MLIRTIAPPRFPASARGSALRDVAQFFRAWIRKPRSVAAVLPSGKALARLITRDVTSEIGPILELGPGTGVFTEALLRAGVAQRSLTLVEHETAFATLLAERYAGATVVQADAGNLAEALGPSRRTFGATICGLGLLNMSEAKVAEILEGAFISMKPGASLYLFTYGRRCSISDAVLARLDLQATLVGRAFLNLPPASVYRVSRNRRG